MQDNSASIKDFKRDMKVHIDAVASKYIIEHETADGAMLFIPAESIFAEIHANHQDIVDYAYKKRVWLASPTTMMAILTTARAVLKDAATRKQIHIIQNHLSALSEDFGRFQDRMDKLAQHIRQTNKDVDLIQTSSKKITARFQKIESVELKEEDEPVSLIKNPTEQEPAEAIE
jgi:DNA recombination protein RmuC